MPYVKKLVLFLLFSLTLCNANETSQKKVSIYLRKISELEKISFSEGKLTEDQQELMNFLTKGFYFSPEDDITKYHLDNPVIIALKCDAVPEELLIELLAHIECNKNGIAQRAPQLQIKASSKPGVPFTEEEFSTAEQLLASKTSPSAHIVRQFINQQKTLIEQYNKSNFVMRTLKKLF